MVGLGMATRASQFPLTFRGCSYWCLFGVANCTIQIIGSVIANLLQLCTFVMIIGTICNALAELSTILIHMHFLLRQLSLLS